ncbi:MAG: hypothetical protein WKF75_09235 [Singulisphaera sp.]
MAKPWWYMLARLEMPGWASCPPRNPVWASCPPTMLRKARRTWVL